MEGALWSAVVGVKRAGRGPLLMLVGGAALLPAVCCRQGSVKMGSPPLPTKIRPSPSVTVNKLPSLSVTLPTTNRGNRGGDKGAHRWRADGNQFGECDTEGFVTERSACRGFLGPRIRFSNFWKNKIGNRLSFGANGSDGKRGVFVTMVNRK